MADIAFEKDLSVTETGIEGLKVVDLAVHGDSRGWFKEPRTGSRRSPSWTTSWDA